MDYLKEVLAFHELQGINRLSAGQIALWYALMGINNKCHWEEWFTVSILTLELNSGLSRKGVYNARNVLSQKGYIHFKEGQNGKSSRYKMQTLLQITHLSTHLTTPLTTHLSTQGTTHPATHLSTPLNKQNETKQNIKENIKEKIEVYAGNELLKKALCDFVDFRNEIKKPITLQGMTRLLNKLDELAKPFSDKERYKCACLDKAMRRNWQDVFAVDDNEFVDTLVKTPEDQSASDRFVRRHEQYEKYVHEYTGSFDKQLDFEEWVRQHDKQH